MCKSRIERMELTIDVLADFNKGRNVHNGMRELSVETGKAISHDIFPRNDGAISVAHTIISPNTRFPIHYHNEREVVQVFKGQVKVFFVDPETKKVKRELCLIKGQVLIIDPGRDNAHYVETYEQKCEIIVSTIPASKGFPKNG